MGTQSPRETPSLPPSPVPALSVIVPAYGISTLLAEAIDSLLAQDRPDWEAIVVDDGDPKVAGAMRAYAGDPRIRLLQTDNRGLPTARNRAIAIARAPFVSLLDGDDAYGPSYVSTMVAAADAPGTGLACCDATYFGHDRVGERFSKHYPQAVPVTLERVLRREFNIFVGATIRRDAIEAVGGFDADLTSAEDFDLWLRLMEAGWTVAYVGEPLVRYRRRRRQMSSDSVGMERAAVIAFERAAARLEGRPERTVALAMRARAAEALEAEMNIERFLAPAEGIHGQSLRWRIARLLVRLSPRFARPLMRLRDWM